MKKHSFKKFFLAVTGASLGLFAFNQINTSAFIHYGEPSNYKIHALNVPHEVVFAGETMQLEEADLRERDAVGLVELQGLADAREGVRGLHEDHRLVMTDLQLHNYPVQQLELPGVRDPRVLDGIFVLNV